MLAAAFALWGCGSEEPEGGADTADPASLRAQAIYACMPESAQREYDAFAARLRRAVRRVVERDEDASGEKIQSDRRVKALADVMDSTLDRYASRVGEDCGAR